MRLAFLALLVLGVGCGDDGSPGLTDTTPDPTVATSTSGSDGPCRTKAECPGRHLCIDDSCQPLQSCASDGKCPNGLICGTAKWCVECDDNHADCAEGEYCYGDECREKRQLGEFCEVISQSCLSNTCGMVNGDFTCVEPCESVEEPAVPVGPFIFPPYECSAGYLCEFGGIQQIGEEKVQTPYCWPEGASDRKGIGEPCLPSHLPNPDCASQWCGYEGCAWNCAPRKLDGTTEWPCPEGLQCADDLANPCSDDSSYCECK